MQVQRLLRAEYEALARHVVFIPFALARRQWYLDRNFL